MSQNDFVIADQSAASALSDINSALQALASCSSGASEPATKYANQLWYDTVNNTLKMRNEANSAWLSVGYLDQSAGAFRVFDDTQVVNTSGTQTGIIGDQATVEWQSGSSTTESLVSPAKVKAAVLAANSTRAWVNFNGSGTIAIRNDDNVSSLTDRGIGQYTVTLTSALSNANYATSDSCAQTYQSTNVNTYSGSGSNPYTTSVAYMEVGNEYEGGLQRQDYAYVSLTVAL